MTDTSQPEMSARTIRPLANPYVVPSGYTRVNNNLFDHIMPTRSGNALKILLVVLRQTWGWADESSPTGRKQSDLISHSQFLAKSGIVSKDTLLRAINECLDAGCLIRTKKGRGYNYALNPAFEIKRTENAPAKSPETEPFKVQKLDTQKKTLNKNGGGADTSVFSLLRDFGINLDSEIRALALCWSYQWIEYAIICARQQAQRNPQGLLIHWMRSGDPPMPPQDLVDDNDSQPAPGIRSRENGRINIPDPRNAKDASESHVPPPIDPARGEAQLLWEQALADLSLQMIRYAFNTWLKRTRGLKLVDDILWVVAENQRAQEWLDNRLRSTIERTVKDIAKRELSIKFVVPSPATQHPMRNHNLQP